MNSFLILIQRLSLRTKLLLALWLLFLFLIAAGIHGSSTGITAGWWAPGKPYTGDLFNVMPKPGQGSFRIDESTLQMLLMGEAKTIRWDELTVATPFALSQLSHDPR